MGKQRYWSGHGRTASNTKLIRNNTNYNNGFDHHHHHHHEASSTSAGCMCAVFQLFDFHPLNHQPPQSPVSLKPISQPLDHHISTGTEAPRNSLESEEESPLPCTPKQEVADGLHFPKGIVEIKTKLGSSPVNSNEISSSPSTKTPTLVARLMGLDLLPQSNNSPSTTPRTANNSAYSLIDLQKPKTGGSRSLPETPRTSCEKKSNFENYHHRLSLQILNNHDKENASPSPSHYAKEIVKQIKETVSRKAGLNDITNYTRRDQQVINQTKPKRVLSSSSGCSSVSREPKNSNKASPKVKTKSKVALKKEAFVVSSRITKAAIDKPLKKCKKTPLSSELLNLNSVTTLVMKKGPPFSSPIKSSSPMQCNRNQGAVETNDKLESKQNLQTCNHQPHIPIIHHHQHVIQLQSPKHHITTTAAVAAADCRHSHEITAEMEYVRQILLRRTTTTTNSVHFLENYNSVSFSHRKLLSHLVEELLMPYVETTPYRKTAVAAERWPEVVEKLCEKVRTFPRAKCEVLEDIDGIIEKDLDILGIGFEEEGEGIVKEIEEWVVEELLNETVRFIEDVRNGVV